MPADCADAKSIAWPADSVERWPIADLIPYARNAKKHPPEQVAQIAQSIREFGFTIPVLVAEDGTIIAGHGRVLAAREMGLDDVPVMVARGWTDEQRRAYTLADNKLAEGGGWDEEMLRLELADLAEDGFDLDLAGFDASEVDRLLDGGDAAGGGSGAVAKGSLAERFGVPPFSVLSARDGWWQDRKRAWLSLGIKSEVGRDIDPTCVPKDAPDYMAGRGNNEGGSIFDPVLCELAYRWFSPEGGVVLDPFAGGSVRGIVAAKLGRDYVGVDLRPEQVAANREQALRICGDSSPVWHIGDSREVLPNLDVAADMVFTCPPYADLEVYSDDPRDISTLDYVEFREAYTDIIAKACASLKEDRFACIVVGEVRDKRGNYYGFVPDTIRAFTEAGLSFYNEAILVTAVGTLPVRTGKQFNAARKLGKTHQNVLVFVKGDPKKATEAIGAVEFGGIGVDDGDGFEVVNA